jgi:LacI family repressor for deo operon, udp, cdd, tsx, nupC, and nupG
MATIEDVAKATGFSTATISRALSRPDVVSEKTRAKVLAAVKRLGYAPNSAAKILRTTRTGKIIVTVPDISNPFFAKVIRGVEQAAQNAGYAVLLGDTRNSVGPEEQYGEMLARREADGVIFLGHRLPDSLAKVVAAKKGRAPVVNGCEYAPGVGVSSVHINNSAAANEAVRFLYNLGHRQIGIVTGPMVSPLSRDRLDGARRAARAQNIVKGLHIIGGDFSIESGERATAELLEQSPPVTALFCFSDEMAIGALAAIRARGLRCPQDISVVGFDDIATARYTNPPLTTVRQPMEQLGASTVRLLLGILQGESSRPAIETLPDEVVVRDSTASCRRKR